MMREGEQPELEQRLTSGIDTLSIPKWDAILELMGTIDRAQRVLHSGQGVSEAYRDMEEMGVADAQRAQTAIATLRRLQDIYPDKSRIGRFVAGRLSEIEIYVSELRQYLASHPPKD